MTQPRTAEKRKIDGTPIVEDFHQLYCQFFSHDPVNRRPQWMGHPAQKCPFDLWVYQEIIFETQPDVIIECGTAAGASALFYSHMCDLVHRGRVITIDLDSFKYRPYHNRLSYIVGNTLSEQTFLELGELINPAERVMVILDDDHSKEHVLKELKLYGELVTPDCYLIVEDTNVNGHPVYVEHGPGPYEAVQEFLQGNNEFVIDKSREKFFLTFNPNGYLKKVSKN